MERRDEIIEDIRNMTKQYRAEVPGGRRAWPKSIRERGIELLRMGMRAKTISDETGVPYFTVLHWRKTGKGEFREVTASRAILPLAKEVGTVTVATKKSASGTVTVTTIQGTRIEGLSFSELLKLWEKHEF